jgi:serine/threonine-protein kinase RsbW
MGVFAKPVTNHTYSQQAGYRLGLGDCGLMHAHVPITATFKAMDETLPRRVGVLLHFKYLNRTARLAIHPPRHHRKIILKIYENLGVSPPP